MMYAMNVPARLRRPEFGFDSLFRALMDEPMMPVRPMQMREEKDAFVVEAAFPGIPQEKIGIEVENDTLKLTVDLRPGGEEHPRHMARFEREISLEGVDADNITASYKDGLLRINLPKEKPADAKPARKIEIRDEDVKVLPVDTENA